MMATWTLGRMLEDSDPFSSRGNGSAYVNGHLAWSASHWRHATGQVDGLVEAPEGVPDDELRARVRRYLRETLSTLRHCARSSAVTPDDEITIGRRVGHGVVQE